LGGSKIVRQATIEDAMAVAENMREADRLEVWASNHLTPEQAITGSLKRSMMAWAVVGRKGEPVAVFGVGAVSIMQDVGFPWLLGTDGVLDIQMEFLKKSRYYVGEMSGLFSQLENFVDSRNIISIKWLEWCGFTIHDEEPYGPDEMMFRRFSMGD